MKVTADCYDKFSLDVRLEQLAVAVQCSVEAAADVKTNAYAAIALAAATTPSSPPANTSGPATSSATSPSTPGNVTFEASAGGRIDITVYRKEMQGSPALDYGFVVQTGQPELSWASDHVNGHFDAGKGGNQTVSVHFSVDSDAASGLVSVPYTFYSDPATHAGTLGLPVVAKASEADWVTVAELGAAGIGLGGLGVLVGRASKK